ncbi:MAG: class I mannose-6-phosphate isomerase [Clostridia bacterium]|nr:class I mannose-6-phosphate isomerase [Clostridia bacterium]
MITPIKTKPVFKQYIWGGSALKDKYNKDIQDNFAAESWEISCHDDGLSLVAEGEHKGRTLKEVIFENKEQMLGDCECERFPLLVKLLDANDKLSVQVHPDDAFAFEHENGSLGKTEMWYVVDAKPGAKLVYGLKDGVTREQFAEAIENSTLEELLNFVPVEKGDTFFIPSKTIHAICEGLLIAEIQQSSNTTYRVYDYNRKDANGNTRELHTEKAIAVASMENVEGKEKAVPKTTMVNDTKVSVLVSCEFFEVVKYDVSGDIMIVDDSFQLFVCTEGCGKLVYDGGETEFNAGDSVFMPAALRNYTICGNAEVLISRVPKK